MCHYFGFCEEWTLKFGFMIIYNVGIHLGFLFYFVYLFLRQSLSLSLSVA